MTSTRDEVLDAARRLFAERGYPQVTIRQIAAEAGVSAAMVMKVGTNKERIYADAAPQEPEPLSPEWPHADLGRELVRRILERRDTNTSEPWMRALLATIDAPDPAGAREAFRSHYVGRLQQRVGRAVDGRERAELVIAMLIGLAAAVRALRLLDDPARDEAIVERYGAMIQSVFDLPLDD